MLDKKESMEFYNLLGRLYDARPRTMQKFWNVVVEVIIRELYTSGIVYLPKIGYFVLEEKPSYVTKEVKKNGTVNYYEIPNRDVPKLLPDDEFVDDINMIGVTKSYRKRVNSGKKTLRDKEREHRAREIMGLNDYEESSTAQLRQKQFYANQFEEKIKKLKSDWDKKEEEKPKEN